MTRPICSNDKYCYDVSEDHWKRYSHPGRTSRTKIQLFHGTKCEHGGSIHAQGLRASTEGRLGPGIYLTTRKEAMKVAQHRGYGKSVYCIEVEVDVGHMKTLRGHENDLRGSWSSQGYHTCKSLHPPWVGVVEYSFPEWCVKDPSRLKIVGAEQIGGTTTYFGNLIGQASLSGGAMVFRNGNGGTVIRTTGPAIVRSNNGSTSVNSNRAGSISITSSNLVDL